MSAASHTHYMEAALAEAQKALRTEGTPQDVPVGAVLVKDGQILAKGHNTREREQNVLGHAELNTLLEACQKLNTWRLSDCTLYVTLEPCPMCASAIVQARIGTLVYGASDPQMGGCGSWVQVIPQTANITVLAGILESPCQKLLRDFFRKV